MIGRNTTLLHLDGPQAKQIVGPELAVYSTVEQFVLPNENNLYQLQVTFKHILTLCDAYSVLCYIKLCTWQRIKE